MKNKKEIRFNAGDSDFREQVERAIIQAGQYMCQSYKSDEAFQQVYQKHSENLYRIFGSEFSKERMEKKAYGSFLRPSSNYQDYDDEGGTVVYG